MASPNYPSNPNVGDTHAVNSITFRWDGEKWKSIAPANHENRIVSLETKTIDLETKKRFHEDTLEEVVNNTNRVYKIGETVEIGDRANGIFTAIATGTTEGVDLPNLSNIIIGVADPLISFVLRDTDGNVLRYGAGVGGLNDGSTLNTILASVNKIFVPKGVTVKATNVAVLDESHLRIRGTLMMPDSSPDWSSILINADTTNGNRDVTIDFTGGEFDGNRANQSGNIHHVPALFLGGCSGFDIFGGKYSKNYAPEVAPSNHPLGPFNDGVPYGEAAALFPTVGMITFMGGRDNHVHNFNLIDWAQEGISPRWNEGSSVTDFRAINGTETSDPYYAPVTFGSRAGSVTVVINDTVLVQEGHEFNSLEQQPHLIYKRILNAGVIDLGLEDYLSADWELVLRDITNDLGFTAARISGAKSQMNHITNGYAAFCRASSFSNDSVMSGMKNLYSYHNSFQVGINFGHANAGGDSAIASGLISINAGWVVSANGYGINLGGGTIDAQISDFYVCGANRSGINQSDSAKGARLSNGIVKFSKLSGIRASATKMRCSNVESRNNGGLDFETLGDGTIVLNNCLDSTGNNLNNDKLESATGLSQTRSTISGLAGRKRTYFRAGFSVAAGNPFVILKGASDTTTDVMTVTITFQQRNSGSGVNANQYLLKQTFFVYGTGTGRVITSIQTHYAQLRGLRFVWDVPTLELRVYLQDIAGPVDVAVTNVVTTCLVEIQNGDNEYDVEIGFES